VVDLYFDTHGTGTRYRSLGCGPCTQPVESSAASAREIVVELTTGRFAKVAERAGRAQRCRGWWRARDVEAGWVYVEEAAQPPPLFSESLLGAEPFAGHQEWVVLLN
jgi:3'-phosphoadenosine 5'-phosphosulfate sulfotransferase (PAPS reductase)/FAD synthetase